MGVTGRIFCLIVSVTLILIPCFILIDKDKDGALKKMSRISRVIIGVLGVIGLLMYSVLITIQTQETAVTKALLGEYEIRTEEIIVNGESRGIDTTYVFDFGKINVSGNSKED